MESCLLGKERRFVTWLLAAAPPLLLLFPRSLEGACALILRAAFTWPCLTRAATPLQLLLTGGAEARTGQQPLQGGACHVHVATLEQQELLRE